MHVTQIRLERRGDKEELDKIGKYGFIDTLTSENFTLNMK